MKIILKKLYRMVSEHQLCSRERRRNLVYDPEDSCIVQRQLSDNEKFWYFCAMLGEYLIFLSR